MSLENLPRHIAIILDGNGRWASKRSLPRTAGHEHGAGAVRTAVRGCHDRGIKFLTLRLQRLFTLSLEGCVIFSGLTPPPAN